MTRARSSKAADRSHNHDLYRLQNGHRTHRLDPENAVAFRDKRVDRGSMRASAGLLARPGSAGNGCGWRPDDCREVAHFSPRARLSGLCSRLYTANPLQNSGDVHECLPLYTTSRLMKPPL